MSRSGYCDDGDDDQWAMIRWRGAVASAIRGKKGQEFLKELLAALDGMEQKRLITDDLEADGAVCTLGAVGKKRGLPMDATDPEDHEAVARLFSIPHSLACEIMFANDEWSRLETPEARWTRMRNYVASLIKPEKDAA
jgi:hypothetical protein